MHSHKFLFTIQSQPTKQIINMSAKLEPKKQAKKARKSKKNQNADIHIELSFETSNPEASGLNDYYKS